MAYNQYKAIQEKEQSYPVVMQGKGVSLPASKIVALIKEKLKQSKSVQHIFSQFEVDPERLEELTITIEPLDKKYAETDLDSMKLNPSLFEGGNFFEEQFFIIAHEIVHWLSRVREDDAYMNDPEEVLGFVSSIAYELGEGTDIDTIWNRIYPKINWHFHNESDAREFMEGMLEKAIKIIR